MNLIWEKIKNRRELPRDGAPFLAFWKGRICIAGYDEEEDRFYISWDPAEYPMSVQLSQDRENKISCIIRLPEEEHPFELEKDIEDAIESI